ncbi:hypothetical protein [Roseovarius rhodophyticola]|uniref:Flagellar FliJ protein n=1 Tax=Roseovarius rhodophyticola TaxID=3080827 RepID=A0ABZ2TJ00_9RHOB|nr:hypothetical protein [Roseovarius sp. W115]MDV2929994.1 hypothetical protein [Roseovarius sp. W115]
MRKNTLQQLSDLTNAKYQADLARLATLKEAEDNVRSALDELDTSRRRNAAALLSELNGQKSLGGDVLWQAWMSRAREARQLEMAQIRAQKEHLLQTLRLSFGRRLAAEQLRERYSADTRKQDSKKHQSEQQSLNILDAAGKQDG